MAVQSDTSSISYTGNNSTVTSYAVPFAFLENTHLAATAKVTSTGVETAVTLTNHTGAGDPNGGTVRTSVAVPATSTLTIYRTVPATQTTTYQEGGDFPAASHERALDKLTFLSQQNERAVERSLRVTEGSGSKNAVVAVPNTLLGLDATNQPKAMTLSEVKTFLALSGVTLDVSAGIKTFADAGERALAVPDYLGQLSSQRDTEEVYISTGTTAGDWALVGSAVSLADFSVSFFTADATGRGKFASGFVDSGLLESAAVTTAKIADANVTTAKLADANVTTAKLANLNVTTGKIADDAVTVAKLGTDEKKQIAKAWVNFNGTGTVAIRSEYNVSSITDNGSGDYTINFTNALASADYAVALTTTSRDLDDCRIAAHIKGASNTGASNKTTTALTIISGTTSTQGKQDMADISATIFV